MRFLHGADQADSALGRVSACREILGAAFQPTVRSVLLRQRCKQTGLEAYNANPIEVVGVFAEGLAFTGHGSAECGKSAKIWRSIIVNGSDVCCDGSCV